jgi:excinuclease UvrABC ATPase subunit
MLDADKKRCIWADIKAEQNEIVLSREDTQRQNENINTDRRNYNNNKGVASFLQRMEHEMSDEEDTNNNEVEAQISNEVMLYEKEKGCALCNEKGNCNCPLLWWNANH